MRAILLTAWLLSALLCAQAQVLTNTSLSGQYFFRHLEFKVDGSANVVDARSVTGQITFSSGQYTFSGQQTVGSQAPVAISGSGVYSVDAGGGVVLTNPQNSQLNLSARLATEALLGSSTDNASNTFDLFAAVPSPAGMRSVASTSGTYFGVSFELPGGDGNKVRSAFFPFTLDGAGNIGPFTASGHNQAQSGGTPTTQLVSGASYGLNADGTGTLTFPSGGLLLGGVQRIEASASGNVILGGGSEAGAQNFLLAIKAAPGAAWSGAFWSAGLHYAPAADVEDYSGSLNVIPSLGNATFTRRLHQFGVAAPYTFTGVNSAAMNPDGSGMLDLNTVGLGAGGNLYVSLEDSAGDPAGHDIAFGARIPTIAGTGLFLSPLAVLNGASFAPPVSPVSPGEFVTLFVSGLPPQMTQGSVPYPSMVGGASVTVNGTPSALSFVSGSQINVLVPYSVSGTTAAFLVTVNGNTSNSVTVPLAMTSPGIFSQNGLGTGLGAVTHADYSLVTNTNPAHRGETLLIFLTGLGAVTNAPADGAASSGNPLSRTVITPNVLVGGQPGAVSFSGLAPGFPGLYQINVRVPDTVPLSSAIAPLAIQTPDAFNDMIDLPVQ